MSTKTKVKMGLLDLTFCPITSDSSSSALPVYEAAANEVSLGHAVRAALSLQINQLRVYGDDALQISADLFSSGTLETEALLDDLALEAALYGSAAASDAVTDDGDDASPEGAVYYVQKLMKKDKSLVYRGVILYRCCASRDSYSDESDTKGESIEPKNHPVSFTVMLTANNKWRWRKDFTSEADALTAIAGILHPSP